MPGRIRDADIATVRERSSIDQVVSQRVTLRNAGGGSQKGLCPFHDENTPSFHVSAARGVYHCFGCGVGGDVIDFVMRTELLSFAEAVEWLASRAGVQLSYTDDAGGEAHGARRKPGQRQQLLAIHRAAADFYAQQLVSPSASIARDFLDQRGFDMAVAEKFGCGFAPPEWDALTKHLLKRGFAGQELVTAGVAKPARSGSLIDRFRRRLVWPIRELAGEVIGFGARKLFDDDDGPKYLNTPETPLYKKSQVLYGLDVAKREIARQRKVVVVEGYTDVMACHLAGVPTAVASCGTAFGAEHISVLRRLLMDQDEFRGEVIFTFDGDEAGQKAALKAFEDEQRFVAQTFIAVSPDNMDPCELRSARGDVAVRDLVARREPLIAFALRNTLTRYDLETPEGRVQALRVTAPLVARIRDRALRPEYARSLAGYLGMEVEPVVRAVGQAVKALNEQPGQQKSQGHNGLRPERSTTDTRRQEQSSEATTNTGSGSGSSKRPEPDDPALRVEREALRLAVQQPALAGPVFDAIDETAYTDPIYAETRRAIAVAGGATAGISGPGWIDKIANASGDLVVKTVVVELAVEPLRAAGEPDSRYVAAVLSRLQELAVERQVGVLKSRLQRINPIERADEHRRLFGELIALEQHKRGLREQGIGECD